MLPYFKWGHLTHARNKIRRAGFNYSLASCARDTPISHQELGTGPCGEGCGSCSLQEEAFDQFFVSLFLLKQRRKHPNVKYKGVKTTEFGRGTIVLTVKRASVTFTLNSADTILPLHQLYTSVHPFILVKIYATINKKFKKRYQNIRKQ